MGRTERSRRTSVGGGVAGGGRSGDGPRADLGAENMEQKKPDLKGALQTSSALNRRKSTSAVEGARRKKTHPAASSRRASLGGRRGVKRTKEDAENEEGRVDSPLTRAMTRPAKKANSPIEPTSAALVAERQRRVDTTKVLSTLSECPKAQTFEAGKQQEEAGTPQATQKRRMRIKELETSAAVAALQRAEQKWEAKEKSLNDLIEHWKAEVQRREDRERAAREESAKLREELSKLAEAKAAAEAKAKTAPAPASSSDGPSLDTKQQQGVINMYRQLTGCSIVPEPSKPGHFFVSATAESGHTATFTLGDAEDTADTVEPELEYNPIENANILPDFLQEPIAFATMQAPVFLTKILQAIRPDPDDDEDDDDEEGEGGSDVDDDNEDDDDDDDATGGGSGGDSGGDGGEE